MAGNEFADWTPYEYNPSGAAAGIFMVLFLLSSLLHTYQLMRTRTWFLIPFLIGAIFEFVGYTGRLVSSTETPNWTLGPYVTQSTLLLVAPALFAASIYMELGRIIVVLHAEEHSLIRVNWLTKIFVGGDVLSFLMQASGAGLMVQVSSQDTGNNVIIGGLFVQLIFFGFFVIAAFIFQRRLRNEPTPQSQQLSRTWRKHLYALYAVSALILIRSIFRVVEYIQGFKGYLLSTEVFLYIFDAVLMLLVVLIYHFVHPSEVNCLLGRGHMLSRKGGMKVTEFEMVL